MNHPIVEEIAARMKENFSKLTKEERVQTLVSAGILNKDLTVAAPYVNVIQEIKSDDLPRM